MISTPHRLLCSTKAITTAHPAFLARFLRLNQLDVRVIVTSRSERSFTINRDHASDETPISRDPKNVRFGFACRVPATKL